MAERRQEPEAARELTRGDDREQRQAPRSANDQQDHVWRDADQPDGWRHTDEPALTEREREERWPLG